LYGEITPLMLAARTGASEMVKLLLTYGANTTLRSEGKTAGEWALFEQHDDVVRLFLASAPVRQKEKSEPKATKSPPSIWDSPKHPSAISSEDEPENDDYGNNSGVFAVMSPIHSPSRSRSPSPALRRCSSPLASPVKSLGNSQSRFPDRTFRSRSRSRSRSPPVPVRGFKKSLLSYIPPAQYRAFAAAANGQDETDKLSHTNVGHRMLQKMGWQEGMGLGRSENGMIAPVASAANASKAGIGMAHPTAVAYGDDSYTKYKKMMMLAYKHRRSQG